MAIQMKFLASKKQLSSMRTCLLVGALFLLCGITHARAQESDNPLDFFNGNVGDLMGDENEDAFGLPAVDGVEADGPSSQPQTGQEGSVNMPPPGTSQEEMQEIVRREAFDAALQGLLPLRPNEIRELLEQFDRTQESVELPVYPMPKPDVAVQTISLDPGTKPAVIKVSHGHVTTLNMLDSSGSPWPIEDISWAGNFEIIQSGAETGSHIVRITPQSDFAFGNMSIKLLGLKTPVILTMETSRDIVHYRFDAIIPEYGPMAEMPLINQGVTIAAGDADMSSILRGVIPDGAKRLNVDGVDSRTTAYRLGKQTYIRTPLTLLSPSWNSSTSSADGMKVYTIQNTPVLLLSNNGRMVRARLSAQQEEFSFE
jgi:intracellular multiplication protein IcmK